MENFASRERNRIINVSVGYAKYGKRYLSAIILNIIIVMINRIQISLLRFRSKIYGSIHKFKTGKLNYYSFVNQTFFC